MSKLNAHYWDKRYKEGNTGWDIGSPSTPLKEYIDTLTDKNLKILIPGAGNAYEAEYLYQKGFNNTYIIDFSATALTNFKTRVPNFPESHIIQGDFFELNDFFDLIIEQTFFCALDPMMRPKYAEKMHFLLKENGILAGLLFNFPLTEEGPPFGGSKEEYLPYFLPYFAINIMEPAYNSIPPRKGKELFILLEKTI